MPPTIRVALYVFAAVAVLLSIAIMLVDEPRQTSGPLATPSLLVDDVPHVRLPPPSSPLLGLSSDERGEVFRTEILAAGFTCDRVTLMERLPEWLPDRGHLFDPSGSTTLAVAARLGPTK